MSDDSNNGRDTTVFLAVRHPGIRHGLRTCLALEPGISILGETGSWDAAVCQVSQLQPDVLLLDSHLIEEGGKPAGSRVQAFGERVKIIILDEETSPDYVRALLNEVHLTECIGWTAIEEIAAAIRRLAHEK